MMPMRRRDVMPDEPRRGAAHDYAAERRCRRGADADTMPTRRRRHADAERREAMSHAERCFADAAADAMLPMPAEMMLPPCRRRGRAMPRQPDADAAAAAAAPPS